MLGVSQYKAMIIINYCTPLASASHECLGDGANIMYDTNPFIKVTPVTEDCIGSQSQLSVCNAVKCISYSYAHQRFTGIDYNHYDDEAK